MTFPAANGGIIDWDREGNWDGLPLVDFSMGSSLFEPTIFPLGVPRGVVPDESPGHTIQQQLPGMEQVPGERTLTTARL
jgi:hypothetical protein